MMNKPRYGLALFLAIFFHALVWSVFFLNFSFYRSKAIFIPATEEREPIEAVALDAKAVEKQVEAIKARDAQKKEQELARQKEADRVLAEAKLQREQEEKKLAEIKAKQAEALREIAAAKKAEELKLAQLKKQQEAEKKALATQEKQRKTEGQKKKELALQEAKKLADLETKKVEQAARQVAQQGELGQIDEVERFKAIIKHKIEQSWIPPLQSQGTEGLILLKILPGGEVALAQMLKSSGDPAWDASIIRAAYKASPLPLPPDPRLFSQFRDLNLLFNSRQSPTHAQIK